jgi:hypothetical protein
MKKIVILLTVVLLLTVTVPAFAGDWKFSGWFDTENTVGESYDGSDLHEYALQVRLGAFNQITDQLSATLQLGVKSYYDAVVPSITVTDTNGADETKTTYATGVSADYVQARLAYITYKVNDEFSFNIGKEAFWMANGLLMDDFVVGGSGTYKISDTTSLWGFTGRYQGNNGAGRDQLVSGLSLDTNIAGLGLGLHYLTSDGAVQGLLNDMDRSSIAAFTAGYNVLPKLNLSVGYAAQLDLPSGYDVPDGESSDCTKFQIYYNGIAKTDLILQYWNSGGDMYWPTENGDHMTWWGHEYGGRGFSGVRLIAVYNLSKNVSLTGAYGSYSPFNKTNNEQDATKITGEITVSF